ncbi:MLO-like protein 15 [Bienertia sinuspersici]
MNQRFNFHKYMVYAYEEDFRKLVSISWFLWLFVVISLKLNVAGWNIYIWISFVPLILLLVIGTKLEQVITELAIDLSQRHTVVMGSSYNAEAMKRHDYRPSNRVTDGRIREEPDTEALIRWLINKFPELQNKQN